MPAIVLPALPRRTEFVFREVSFDRDAIPVQGGDEARYSRLGTRHAIDVSIDAIAAKGCGPSLVVDLSLGRTQGVVIAVPEFGLAAANYGVPLVNGGGQLGSTLNVDGLVNGVVIPKGKWLSVIVAGRRYAYFTTAAVTVAGGAAALPIYPMIRAAPSDNAVVELATPRLEGLVEQPPEWSPRKIGSIGIQFAVRERG